MRNQKKNNKLPQGGGPRRRATASPAPPPTSVPPSAPISVPPAAIVPTPPQGSAVSTSTKQIRSLSAKDGWAEFLGLFSNVVAIVLGGFGFILTIISIAATLWPNETKKFLGQLYGLVVFVSSYGLAMIIGLFCGIIFMIFKPNKLIKTDDTSVLSHPAQEKLLSPLPPSVYSEPMKARAKRYVECMHEAWFPKLLQLHGEDYRISLYVPYPSVDNPTKWICLARSFTKDKPREWKNATTLQEASAQGVVNSVAFHKELLDEDGVVETDRSDKQKLKDFLSRTHLTEALHKVRRWKWASIMATPGQLRSGQCVCVFVIERESGQRIETTTKEFVDICKPPDGAHEIVVQGLVLAADLWARLAQGERADE